MTYDCTRAIYVPFWMISFFFFGGGASAFGTDEIHGTEQDHGGVGKFDLN